jgi:hypothetical protein
VGGFRPDGDRSEVAGPPARRQRGRQGGAGRRGRMGVLTAPKTRVSR